MPSLVPDCREFRVETARLLTLLTSTGDLAPTHRKFIAEIALLRLAILIENSMRKVFCKLICGAMYINGTAPALLARQRNIPAAIAAMRSLGRARPRHSLRWNDGAEIRENIRYLIDPTDRCHADLITHASFLTDVRWIRNHIAHRNDNSRANFVQLVRRFYGARVPGVTCGNLLVSPRVSPGRPLLERYIVNANIMMEDIVRG
jgi:hypothetical protein